MKHIIKLFLSLSYRFETLYLINLFTFFRNKVSVPIFFYKSKAKLNGYGNEIILSNEIERSIFNINGNSNRIGADSLCMVNTSISILGNNNEVIIAENAKLRNCELIIRGTACKILIGSGTTFGGARIINVGKNNNIEIGRDCLFADHIEIWASDTHAILNNDNEMINPEKSVVIKDNVWIGAHVKILKGVNINEGSVIGMATLVTKDVPSNTLSIGNPNKVIRDNINWKRDYPVK